MANNDVMDIEPLMEIANMVLRKHGWRDFCSFARANRNTMYACCLLMKSVNTVEIHESRMIIEWNNQKFVHGIAHNDEFAEFFTEHIGSRVQSLFINCEQLKDRQNKLFENLTSSKSLSNIKILGNPEIKSISGFCGTKTKSITIPSIAMLMDNNDELDLDLLSIGSISGIDLAKFPWNVGCLRIGENCVQHTLARFLECIHPEVVNANAKLSKINSIILDGNWIGTFDKVQIDEFISKMSLFHGLQSITIGLNMLPCSLSSKFFDDLKCIEEAIANTFKWTKISYVLARRDEQIDHYCRKLKGFTKFTTDSKPKCPSTICWRKLIQSTDKTQCTTIEVQFPKYFTHHTDM